MGALIKLAGSKHGRLLVIKRHGKDRHGKATWNCLCDCGKTITVRGVDLVSGHTQSCGCLSRAGNDAALNGLLRDYKRRARERNLDFSLTKNEFEKITQKNCHYCGAQPFNKTKWSYADTFLYNGVDRIDSDNGYVLGNVLPCCKYCNFLKGRMDYKEFMLQVQKIYKHQLSLRAPNTACSGQGQLAPLPRVGGVAGWLLLQQPPQPLRVTPTLGRVRQGRKVTRPSLLPPIAPG